MANLTNVDFYYGAVISHLLTSNSEHNPCLIEDSKERRVFCITTDKHEYVLRTHKSEGNREVKEDAISWTFTLSPNVIRSLNEAHSDGKRNVIALVLVDDKELAKSKIIYFTDNHLQAKGVFDVADKSIGFTVRKYPNKNDYLLFVDKKVDNAIPVKQNLRLDY